LLVAGCAVHPLTPTPEPTATLPKVAVVMVTFTPTVTPPASETPRPTETEASTIEPGPTAVPVLVPPTAEPVLAAPLPGLAAPPPAEDVAAAEQYTIDLINAQRTAAGVAPLLRDETLMDIARARVQDMIARSYTGHNDPVTGAPMARTMMRAAGYTSAYVGENWYGSIKAPPTIVDVAMGWFMTDPPHAKNILSPNYVVVGIGIGFNGRQWLLIQNFAGANQ
jgi:uncharacterized protein YkwD